MDYFSETLVACIIFVDFHDFVCLLLAFFPQPTDENIQFKVQGFFVLLQVDTASYNTLSQAITFT